MILLLRRIKSRWGLRLKDKLDIYIKKISVCPKTGKISRIFPSLSKNWTYGGF